MLVRVLPLRREGPRTSFKALGFGESVAGVTGAPLDARLFLSFSG